MAFIKVHYPDIDADAIVEGIPLDARGDPVDMEALLPLVESAAKQVIGHVDGAPKEE